MSLKIEYKGWAIRIGKQNWILPYVATVRLKNFIFNAEGHTEEEALAKAKQRIDENA
jgi:hypothetical protein